MFMNILFIVIYIVEISILENHIELLFSEVFSIDIFLLFRNYLHSNIKLG